MLRTSWHSSGHPCPSIWVSCRTARPIDGSVCWCLKLRASPLASANYNSRPRGAGNTADIVVISTATHVSKASCCVWLFAVDKGTAEFEVVRRFAKLCVHASDTCLLARRASKCPRRICSEWSAAVSSFRLANLQADRVSKTMGSDVASGRAPAITLSYVHGPTDVRRHHDTASCSRCSSGFCSCTSTSSW